MDAFPESASIAFPQQPILLSSVVDAKKEADMKGWLSPIPVLDRWPCLLADNHLVETKSRSVNNVLWPGWG